jgi:hypothetical protein
VTYLHRRDQQARTRAMVLHAYDRAAARHQIRQMGHPLPDPVDEDARWRHRFEDAVFGLLTRAAPPHLRVLSGLGRGEPSQAAETCDPVYEPSALTTLDGGSEDAHNAAVGQRPGPEASSQAAVGGEPPAVVSVQRPEHPTNLTGQGHGGSGLAEEDAARSVVHREHGLPRPPALTNFDIGA